MADRRHIEGMIKKKFQEIDELKAKIHEAQVYLQALQDVLKKFPKDSPDAGQISINLRQGSLVAQAREAILKSKKPMHIDEILQSGGRGLTRENRTALGSSLSAYVRKGLIFTRPAPNTFGLLETEVNDEEAAEPPSDFGMEIASANDEEEIPF